MHSSTNNDITYTTTTSTIASTNTIGNSASLNIATIFVSTFSTNEIPVLSLSTIARLQIFSYTYRGSRGLKILQQQ